MVRDSSDRSPYRRDFARPPRATAPTRPGRSKASRGPAWWRKSLGRIPRPLRWALMCIVTLILLSMVIDAAMFYNKVHAGVTIEGQSVSGLTPDAAIAKIGQFVADSQNSPITLTGDGKTWQVKPAELGTTIDVAAAVTAALNVTRDSNVVVDQVTKLKLYFGSRDLPLQGTVDSDSLDALIAKVAGELDQPAVDAALTIRGATVSMLESKDGLVVDRETLKQTLTQTLLSLHSTEITVPMVTVKPSVVTEDNAAALAQAKIMVSAPLTLTWGDKSWTFTPQEIASFIVFTPEDESEPSATTSTSLDSTSSTSAPSTTTSVTSAPSTTTSSTSEAPTAEGAASTPRLSPTRMAARLQEIGTQTTATPVDATLKIVNKKVQVIPGVEGVVLDTIKTAEALTVAARQATGRTAEVAGTKQEPETTTAEAEAMGITDLLGEYTTKYIGVENRRTNVRLTVEYLLKGGKLYLKPGQELSFKATVGPRTPERGFKKAPGIVPGIVLEDVYGGGICQVSTTLFNTVLLAGLKVTERRNHTLYIDHYPKGRDATVTDDGPDFKFVNSTDHYIWLTGKSDGKTTTLQIYGTSDGRKVSLEVSKWYGVWGPYTSTTLDPSLRTGVSILIDKGQTAKMCMLTRTITWPDGKRAKDQFESNYKHRYAIVKVGTGTTTTTVYHPPTTTTVP